MPIERKIKSVAKGTRSAEEWLRGLSESAQLLDIRLTKLEAFTLAGDGKDPELIPGVHPAPPEYYGNFDPELRILFCVLRFRLVGNQPEVYDSPEPLMLDAQYELFYRVDGTGEIDDEVVELFAARDGVTAAWPYFRELVRSTASMMGFSGMVVPLLRPTGLVATEGPGLRLRSRDSE